MSYVYTAMYSYFLRDDVGLPGFAAYFRHNSDDERTHAHRLLEYQVCVLGLACVIAVEAARAPAAGVPGNGGLVQVTGTPVHSAAHPPHTRQGAWSRQTGTRLLVDPCPAPTGGTLTSTTGTRARPHLHAPAHTCPRPHLSPAHRPAAAAVSSWRPFPPPRPSSGTLVGIGLGWVATGMEARGGGAARAGGRPVLSSWGPDLSALEPGCVHVWWVHVTLSRCGGEARPIALLCITSTRPSSGTYGGHGLVAIGGAARVGRALRVRAAGRMCA